jgi:hypothetical protein
MSEEWITTGIINDFLSWKIACWEGRVRGWILVARVCIYFAGGNNSTILFFWLKKIKNKKD